MIQFKFIRFLIKEKVFSYADIQDAIISKYGKSGKFELFLDLFNSSLHHIQDEDLLNSLKRINNEFFTLQKGFSYLGSYLYTRENFELKKSIHLLLELRLVFKTELSFTKELDNINIFLMSLDIDQGLRKNNFGETLNLPNDLKSFFKEEKSAINIDSKDKLIMSLLES